MPTVARPVPRASRGLACHLGLVGALLGPVHRIRESGRHSPGVRHRVDPPCLLSAGGANHRITRLRERTPLLERPAILTKKLVVRHSISSPTLLNSDSHLPWF